ncbi:hypothetical protein, partial [Mycobacterium sp. 1465703.0]|uniref:hypothetical protein n=1 Tax=Mycobacterium sp. 1465703.0 TaxID=1834078 RepID=UPI001E5D4139
RLVTSATGVSSPRHMVWCPPLSDNGRARACALGLARVLVAGFQPFRVPLSLKGGHQTMCLGDETPVADVTRR